MPKIILAARGRITSRFGENIGRGFPHRGIDQGHGDGEAEDLEIRAPADGVVTFAGEMGSYGLCYFITHNDGWVSVLAHHARHLVSKGQRVTQGQPVAVMGNTGTVYVHSHQELRDAQGNQRDPLQHLGTSTASATPKPVTPKPRRKTMTGAFYRIASGEGEGVIYWQEKPNTVLVLLDYVTWSAYAAQGNLYKDITAAEAQALIQKHGQSAVPAPN